MREMKQRVEIKKWLLDAGITQTDVAKATGASKALVCRVVAGERGASGKGLSGAVLEFLKRHGCPVVSDGDAA
jgi:predicted transcriptional regulator